MSLNHNYCKELTKVYGGEYFDSDNILWRWVGDEFIGKPAVQTKDFTIKWFDEVTPDEIDTRFYNLDGTKK